MNGLNKENKQDRSWENPPKIVVTFHSIFLAVATCRMPKFSSILGELGPQEFGACSGTPICLSEIHRITATWPRSNAKRPSGGMQILPSKNI